jgi:plastocyanin
MSSEKTPLVNKLILLVLVLILGCLVLLIAQRYADKREPEAPSTVAQNSGEDISESSPPRPSHFPLTNRARAKVSTNSIPPRRDAAVELADHRAPNVPQTIQPSVLPQPKSAPLVNVPSAAPARAPLSTAGAARSGGVEIAGYIWLTGAPPPEKKIVLDATCGQVHPTPLTTRHYVVSEDGGLANVFVYIKTGLENRRFPAPTNTAVLDNVSCLFEPYVLGVQTRQLVEFRNSDPVLHNVHVTARKNPEINLALPRQDYSLRKTFAAPEVFLRVQCDVHPWMFAYIGVLPHPFFAVTDAEGIYRLPPHLPSGTYTVVAHHVKAGGVSQEIIVREGESFRLDFNLGVPAGL